ncbi:hypothetical protein D3C73_803400 [compost metagenome]
MAVRQDTLDDPLARPLAEPAATHDRLMRRLDLKAVAFTGEELVETRRHVRQHVIGRHETTCANATEQENPDPRHSSHEEHAAPDDAGEDRLAKVGLGDQKCCHDAEQDDREEVAGDFRLPRMFGKQPGANDHEGWLHEFGRLDREDTDADPATRTLDLDAEKQRQNH